eukprot:TRINITY_DN72861_c0_g1_i1.p1 TRINITY_DN72861_c0_g1~~TRINITY_DN72861_c0_g1_i1.p1  ORF type:complete len:715 (-),score=147.62 TRINITY_DN72861_c0_g1_i1:31-2175(-)
MVPQILSSFVGFTPSAPSRPQAPSRSWRWSLATRFASRGKSAPGQSKQDLLDLLKDGRNIGASAQKLRKGNWLTEPEDFDILITAQGKQGWWRQAILAFAEMREAGLQAGASTYSAVIGAMGLSGQWPHALHLLAESREESVAPDVAIYGSAIESLEGHWERALALLEEMQAEGLDLDVVSYGAAIGACAKALEWQQALTLLERAKTARLEPGERSFNAAISACEQSGKWQLALAMVQEMRDLDLEPDEETYRLLLAKCGQSGSEESPSEVVKEDSKSKPSSSKKTKTKKSSSKKKSSVKSVEIDDDVEETGAKNDQVEEIDDVEETIEETVAAEDSPQVNNEDGVQLMPCTSASNARRHKGKVVGKKQEGLSTMVEETPLPRVPAVPTPGPLRQSKPMPMLPSGTYAKELRVLKYVLENARPGDPSSVCEAIENFGDHVLVKGRARMWLKIAGGVKTDVLQATMRGAPIGDGDLQNSILEIGCYCGYSSTRMAMAVPGIHIASLEVDPVHVVVARNVIKHGGLEDTIDVWTGHSKDLLQRILTRYGGPGHLQFGAAFFDQKGSRYSEDMERMESEGLMAPGAVVIADNVLKPGAPLYLYKIMKGGHYHGQIVSMDEFAMPSEDWMSLCVKKKKVPDEPEPEPPDDLLLLSKEADRMRDRAVGPGRSVDYDEWGEFAQEVKVRLKKFGVELTADLRSEASRDRDSKITPNAHRR